MNAPLGGHLWDQLSVHLQGGVHLLESLIKGVNINRLGQTLGVHFTEVSIKRVELPVYRIQVVASIGKMTLQINLGLLRTVKKDTEMTIIVPQLVRSEICRISLLHYPIPITHILSLSYLQPLDTHKST